MYNQQKKITVKVTHLKVGYNGAAGFEEHWHDYIGTHLTARQAQKFINDMYGLGYLLEEIKYSAEIIPLDIEKIYKEYKQDNEKIL